MSEKELRHMSRTELIEIIYAQQQNEKTLREEIDQLQAQLKRREIAMQQSGNIAEAALKLQGVFEAAQAAADQYLQSVKANAAQANNQYSTSTQPTQNPRHADHAQPTDITQAIEQAQTANFARFIEQVQPLPAKAAKPSRNEQAPYWPDSEIRGAHAARKGTR